MNSTQDWIDDKVSVSDLSLDLQNPRLPKYVKDQNDINSVRNHLLEKEGVLKIARSIVSSGYHKSAVAIVCRENGKLIVLDGNRRLAACQFLLDPSLVPNARDKKEFENLKNKLDVTQLEAVKITIAPSRKDAEKEIWDIHVNQLLKPWQVLQKLRMYRNLIDSGDYDVSLAAKEYGLRQGDFKNELAKLYFFEHISEQNPESEDILLDSGFNKIDRLVLSKNGKKYLDYSVDDRGNIVCNNKVEHEKKLEKLVPYIIEPANVDAQANKDWIKENVFSKLDPANFPPSAPVRRGTKTSKKNRNLTTTGSMALPDWVTLNEYKSYSGSNRVKDIFNELFKNKPKKDININLLAVALRVIIELAIYDKLKNKGYITLIISTEKQRRVNNGQSTLSSNWTPGLKEMLKFMLDEANQVVVDPQDRKTIGRIMNKRKDFIDDLDNFIHNPSYHPTETDVKDTWKVFCRPIFDIISKVK